MVKILVTDDSEFMRNLIKKTLIQAGYKDIIQASDSEEAIKKYESEKPDLVLLDMVMTKETGGLEALEAIKKINKNAKIIMVTVMDQEELNSKAKQLGALDYVAKPINEQQLIDAVKSVLGWYFENGIYNL